MRVRAHRFAVIAFATAMGLAACGGGDRIRRDPPAAKSAPSKSASSPRPARPVRHFPPQDGAPPSPMQELIVISAFAQSGKYYQWGGVGPEHFDCSGLVRYVYSQVGLKVPRTTLGMWREGRTVDLLDVRGGDLLFYYFEDKPDPSHVMIYLGNGEAIHAPATGKYIRSLRVDGDGLMAKFAGVRRFVD